MAQVIRPEDFNKKTTDPNRHIWRWEDMEALVTALDGAEVIVETSRGLGSAWPLSMVHMSGRGVFCRGAGIPPQGLIYPLDEIGVIVDPRPDAKAKWDAIELLRQRRMAKA